MKRPIRYLFVMTGLVALLIAGCDASAQKAGGPAAEIDAADWLNTEPLTLAALKGKVVVVEFWATWCPPCRASIPHLAKLNEKHQGDNFAMISLTNEPKSKVVDFAKKSGMTWPVGCGSNTSGKYGVKGIPHAFVIDPKGDIVWRGHPMSGLDAAVADALKAAK